MRYLLLLSLVSAIVSPAVADDAYWSAVGGAGNFGKSKDIRMVSELVQITLKHASMHVHATFNFQNDGAAQTVTMAFPETMSDYKERRPGDTIGITSFKSWVDGKPVRVTRKEMSLKDLDDAAQYSAVWLKQVPFDEKGKRQVVCDYEARYSEGRQYLDAYYILRTGGKWKDSIGSCVVRVDWSLLKGLEQPQFHAAQAPIMPTRDLRASATGASWAEFAFKNLKPTFDIEMSWPSGFWNFTVNGRPPNEFPMRVDGETEFHGGASDPALDFDALPNLLGTTEEVAQADKLFQRTSGDVKSVRVHGHEIKYVREGLLSVDGKKLKVRIVYKSSDAVYVRDIVKALGGQYRYDPVADRADIRVR